MQYCKEPGCEMGLPYGLRQFCKVCEGKADREEKLKQETDEKELKKKEASDALASANKGKKKPKTVKQGQNTLVSVAEIWDGITVFMAAGVCLRMGLSLGLI